MLLYEEPLYRPPSEAYSLIIQATIGCSHNQCTFCSMYKNKKFRIRSLEEILIDLSIAKNNYQTVHRIFLADGDALIMPYNQLMAILEKVRELFPECQRVTCYASPKSLLSRTKEELCNLHLSGLTMLYMGLETGNEALLKKILKGVSLTQMIKAGRKAKDAGFLLSVTAINGLGGTEASYTHAVDTGKVFSEINPNYIGLLTLMLEPGTILYKQWKERKIELLSSMEILRETYYMLEYTNCTDTIFRANHASNYLSLKGTLPNDKEYLMKKIEEALLGRIQLKNERWRRL